MSFLIFEKSQAARQQTSTLRRETFGWLYVKFNLESNELLFFLKTTGIGKNMVKTKVVRKKAKWRHSEAMG